VKCEQFDGYLAAIAKSQSISSLQAFPVVVKSFQKSSSTLPSSAAVERLFSAASKILTNRRCRMGDETIDHLVFLRSRLSLDTVLAVADDCYD